MAERSTVGRSPAWRGSVRLGKVRHGAARLGKARIILSIGKGLAHCQAFLMGVAIGGPEVLSVGARCRGFSLETARAGDVLTAGERIADAVKATTGGAAQRWQRQSSTARVRKLRPLVKLSGAAVCATGR
jgi:hypothetical protein